MDTESNDDAYKDKKWNWSTQSEIKKAKGLKTFSQRILGHIRNFERSVWFRLGENLWSPSHRTVWKDQREYLKFNIKKPYKWHMTTYINRCEVLANLLKYMQPPSQKGQDEFLADWKMRNKGMAKIEVR